MASAEDREEQGSNVTRHFRRRSLETRRSWYGTCLCGRQSDSLCGWWPLHCPKPLINYNCFVFSICSAPAVAVIAFAKQTRAIQIANSNERLFSGRLMMIHHGMFKCKSRIDRSALMNVLLLLSTEHSSILGQQVNVRELATLIFKNTQRDRCGRV